MKNVLIINGHQKYDQIAEGNLTKMYINAASEFFKKNNFNLKYSVVESDYDVMKGHIEQAPLPPSSKNPRITQIVDNLVMKSLNKLPADRYQDCSEFYSVCDHVH